MNHQNESLDPADWEEFRRLSHKIIDDSVDYLRDIRDQPVWRNMPDDVRARFQAGLPQEPTALSDVYGSLVSGLMPYPMGNIHPRFWMWFMGSSNATGALADFLAAVVGSNLGGGNHAAAEIDRQVIDWCKEMIGFPKHASGTLVSGGSMANIICLAVARNSMSDFDIRENGVAAQTRPLRFYASDQLHGCHQKAMELLGLGNAALCRIASTPDFRIDVGLLEEAIARDRSAGLKPACIIATAGTVNTGAIDDIGTLTAICRREGMWIHVDGCVGALIAIAPENRHCVAGLEAVDSVAMDPHKLLHAPFEVGCAMVRDGSTHRAAFASSTDYLQEHARGIAAAEWLHEYGVQTSRGFRALKVWMALQEHGVKTFGRLIDQNIAQARHLTELIEIHSQLEVMAPTPINIVCFRYNPGSLDDEDLKAVNMEIMLRLQESGVAAISDTVVHGRHCLRAAIANHRTRVSDLDLLVDECIRFGDAIVGERAVRS